MKRIAAPFLLSAGLGLGTIAADLREPLVAIPGYERVALQLEFADLQGHTSSFIRVDCPEGKNVLGGGVAMRDAENRVLRGVELIESSPLGETGWIGSVAPADGSEFPATGNYTVHAICATVTP